MIKMWNWEDVWKHDQLDWKKQQVFGMKNSGWMGGWMDGRVGGWMEGWVGGWKGGWVDGRVEGETEKNGM